MELIARNLLNQAGPKEPFLEILSFISKEFLSFISLVAKAMDAVS